MIKAKTILSLFLFITLHQLEAQNFSVCLHFSPKPTSAICSISLNTKVSKTFQAKDTCINLNISGRSQHSLEVSALGYKTESITFNLDTLRKPLVITLQEKNILLQEVEVKASPLITMKGDTLVINAKNIFTKPQSDATELINNLPGGMITPNGQIYLFGKPISNITIEGMSIFGGNPKTILMLLKADMVASLEILPNGDNQRNEVNIRLKEGRKKGIYGEVEALAGSFDRESEGIKINRISPNKFLSFFSTANNLNQKNATIGNSISLANSFFKRIDGAYSLTEFIDGYTTEASKFKYLPTSINDDGINTNKTTGINYSFKVKNQDWIAFSVLDASKRSYQELNTKSLYFSDKELFKNISDNRNYKTYEWLNTVGLNWKVDAKNTLKWLQSYRWTNATIDSKYNSTSSIASIDVNDLNIFDNQSYRTQHNFIANQQLQLIHRHQKP
ncbi:hypothetical protein VB264_12855 [Arcicella aquatica]|uniref:Uncharacterized protein n=1 Tax=Arcicella aquatica TaxID=217141 RepID=A0ABU5QPS5_9BACT|nr:hypothetical protein [Arcicella aquatica]MEA5258679.1 hypothetical protein [Arcicella aquatica]